MKGFMAKIKAKVKTKKITKRKSKKKNPSVQNEIHAIERMKRMLSSWNLKYDEFPDVKEYVNKHWTSSYGKREALDLLLAAMNQRSSLYYNVERMIPPGGTLAGRQLEKAEKNWSKVIGQLNGIQEIGEVEQAAKPKPKYPGYNQDRELRNINWEWDV